MSFSIPKISHNYERIGPVEAARILAHVHPRQKGRDHQGTIDKYAHDMARGAWDTGVAQTISISDRGELLDGWHRLHAVVKSGASVSFLVARRVPSESFHNYDSGKARSLAFRAGIDKDTVAIGSIIARVIRHGSPGVGTSVEELETILDFIRPELTVFMAGISSTSKRSLTSAPIKAACILRMKMHQREKLYVLSCFKALQQGDLTSASRVIGSLYRRLLEGRNSPLNAFALAFMAFDPARRDNSRLQLSSLPEIIAEAKATVLAELIDAIG